MDKFGIFKLLNSFFDFYKNGNAQSSPPPADKTNSSSAASSERPNLLEGLFKGFNNAQPQQNTPPQKEKIPVPAPLQVSMLNTIHSHDAFINRVKSGGKK